MASRTNQSIGSPGFLVDRDRVTRTTGFTIDWANVPDDVLYRDAAGDKAIKAGTRMALAPDGVQLIPRSGAAPAVGILETNAHQHSRTDALSGYSLLVGGNFYENLLPGAAGIPPRILAAERTELEAADMTVGFGWMQYRDTTVS